MVEHGKLLRNPKTTSFAVKQRNLCITQVYGQSSPDAKSYQYIIIIRISKIIVRNYEISERRVKCTGNQSRMGIVGETQGV